MHEHIRETDINVTLCVWSSDAVAVLPSLSLCVVRSSAVKFVITVCCVIGVAAGMVSMVILSLLVLGLISVISLALLLGILLLQRSVCFYLSHLA